jgi:hypothetical protein
VEALLPCAQHREVGASRVRAVGQKGQNTQKRSAVAYERPAARQRALLRNSSNKKQMAHLLDVPFFTVEILMKNGFFYSLNE